VPVRITGLETVPNADDSFQVVPDLATAREIADSARARPRRLLPRLAASRRATIRGSG
jgi:translation initiation factor IF-2